jgi:hydrogenase nickel insertion protein HypA
MITKYCFPDKKFQLLSIDKTEFSVIIFKGKTMHEFALAEDIVTALKQKMAEDFDRLSKVSIEVGSLSGVVADSLEFGLQIIFQEERSNNVDIEIISVASRARCECGHKYKIEDMFSGCPRCQSFIREIISGKDILIDSVEIEDHAKESD